MSDHTHADDCIVGDPVTCWSCDTVTDAVSDVDGGTIAPEAGDCSLCLYCVELGVFTGNGLETREPTDEERATFLADEGVTRAMAALTMMRAGDQHGDTLTGPDPLEDL
jgi:hypothetical protein